MKTFLWFSLGIVMAVTLAACSSGGGGGGGTQTQTSVKLPRTGQTASYDTGTVPADDGALQRGVVWPNPRFTVGTGAGVDCVTDNLTGLMWVKAQAPTFLAWSAALTYADGLTLCGHSDWRLPNRKELRSLVDYSQYNLALPSGHPFTNVQTVYWSSTTYAGDTTIAWSVGITDGSVYLVNKVSGGYVWPVRSGQ